MGNFKSNKRVVKIYNRFLTTDENPLDEVNRKGKLASFIIK